MHFFFGVRYSRDHPLFFIFSRKKIRLQKQSDFFMLQPALYKPEPVDITVSFFERRAGNLRDIHRPFVVLPADNKGLWKLSRNIDDTMVLFLNAQVFLGDFGNRGIFDVENTDNIAASDHHILSEMQIHAVFPRPFLLKLLGIHQFTRLDQKAFSLFEPAEALVVTAGDKNLASLQMVEQIISS